MTHGEDTPGSMPGTPLMRIQGLPWTATTNTILAPGCAVFSAHSTVAHNQAFEGNALQCSCAQPCEHGLQPHTLAAS
jgi:hypothetical protein